MIRTGIKTGILGVGLTLFAAGATRAAVLIEPAGSYLEFPLEGVTAADLPGRAGVILEDVVTPFTLGEDSESVSGHIRNRVVRSGETGTLSFYWRVVLSDSNPDINQIIAFRLGGFESLPLMDAGWRMDSPGVVAPYAARYFGSAEGSINFLFNEGELSGGQSSRFFYLRTSAVAYDSSGVVDLLCARANCQSPLYSTFAPAKTPASLVQLP